MQKIIVFILTIVGTGLIFFLQADNALAFECQSGYTKRADESGCDKNPTNSTNTTPIYTSEMVPGANCKCVTSPSPSETLGNVNVACTGTVEKRKYKCEIPAGLSGFQSVFKQIIRFVVNIVLLLGVLAIVGLGIAWSFAGGDDVKAKSTLKTWGINIIIGLIILFFFTSILYFLAPWVYE